MQGEGLSTKGEAGKAKLQINGKPAKCKTSSPETTQRLGKMGPKKKNYLMNGEWRSYSTEWLYLNDHRISPKYIHLVNHGDITQLIYLTGEGNGTPLQYSCLEIPMDGGAW